MYGLWELAGQMTAHPEPKMQAYLWKWDLFESIIEQSGEVVPVGNERRALQLFNPGLDGRWATTNSLVAAVQMLLPGETAPAHRHVPTAIRFIMEGAGAYTAVDGERIYMKPGDLVLTPSWTWHDHGNETDERVVWLDGLDIPLIQSLETMFFQPYEQRQVPLLKPHNDSEKLFGHGNLAPTWVREKPLASPLLIYAWDDAFAALMAMQDHDGDPKEGNSAGVHAPADRRAGAADHGLLHPADPGGGEAAGEAGDGQRRVLRRTRSGGDDYRRRAVRVGQGRRAGHAFVGFA